MAALPPIAVSMGEPAGIGPDLILKLYAERAEHSLPPFVVYGSMAFLAARARRLGLNINFASAGPQDAADQFPVALPVSHVEGLVPDKPGDTSLLSGKVVIESISRAVRDTLAGDCRALMTAPIHKAALYAAGFKHPGHTEFLASLCNKEGDVPHAVMMLTHGALRVVPLTIHVPLRAVPNLITPQLIRDSAQVVEQGLRTRFNIQAPRIAVTGLNPHAGEGGTIGTEDQEIVGPAVQALNHNGMLIDGPFAADSLFAEGRWRGYDAVIAMYHDQALIPIKAMAFNESVNVTLGLPIVRTSPDHGTAFDLAGTGKANASSMLAALRLADTMTGGHFP